MTKPGKNTKTTKRSKIKEKPLPSRAERTSYKEVRTERIRNRQMGKKS